MKISYNWLKNYLDLNIDPTRLAEILTNIGLEVESMEKFEAIKGGMEGFVTGKVITCEKHPNANKLSLTTVDTGESNLLHIVCGAPNVASGQSVIVATIGATVHLSDDSFKIKKSKIRGELSEGMICAEDELGIGTSHDGILVLSDNPKPGIPAKEYFNLPDDIIYEIGLTPNRIDAASHFGVARDLSAYLSQDHKIKLIKPSVKGFRIDNITRNISVEIANHEACIRYSGLTISDIEVNASPEWLQNKIKSIGLTPINNIVDVTNFVLHEIGQPLHAFDADKISGNKVIIKTLANGTKFTTLDEVERELDSNDLMICNSKAGMCMAGVFGGLKSGVSSKTRNIFLESACFNPVFIRKTSKRHGLNTDSSFRFERGSDPNITVYALKRAAMLIKEIAGGVISSDIVDIYPKLVNDFPVNVSYKNIDRLIGNIIDRDTIKHIIKSLEIVITNETDDGLSLLVPTYRVDVKREADIIEEILRIYGYNFVTTGKHVNSTITHYNKPDEHKTRNLIAEHLSSNGFNEIMSNSLTKRDYYTGLEIFNPALMVPILNPLSNDLNVMRQSLLFGGLESIAYNSNRKNSDLKLYEFGACYFKHDLADHLKSSGNYFETQHLAMFITGNISKTNWNSEGKRSTYFHLKSYISQIFNRLGIDHEIIDTEEISNEILTIGLKGVYKGKTVVEYGIVNEKILKLFDIDHEVFYANFDWDYLFSIINRTQIKFEELPKFPSVRRDLALVVNKNIRFEDIRNLAYKAEKKLLKDVSIFDVYQGDKIPEGKKSYAISLILQDSTTTLNDKYIDKVIQEFIRTFENELGAEIRK